MGVVARFAENGADSRKIELHHSTLFSALLSPDELRRREASHVATLNETGEIDRRILDGMRRGISLGEIATELRRDFPGRFSDWQGALGRVGELSRRYTV